MFNRCLRRTIAAIYLLAAAVFPSMAEAGAPATANPRPLRLTFAGDIMAHVPNYTYQPYEGIYAPVVRLLKDCDLSFANLEFPVDDAAPYASFPRFNVHSEYVWAAITAGFNVFSLANNHTADRGPAGVASTDRAIKSLADRARRELLRDIGSNGLRPDKADPPWRMDIIRAGGLKLGFVAVAEWVNETQHTRWVQHYDCREDPADTRFEDWIASVRPSVDLLVLSYHWGDEYVFLQSAKRAAFTRRLVDVGVDILWGNHPHVLQQWYTLDGPRGQALVMPSLGNFVSGQTWYITPDRKGSIDAAKGNSMLFKVSVDRDAAGRIRFPELNPVLVSSYKLETGQVVVRTNADLLASLKGDWLKFYQYRNSIMTDFIKNSDQASKVYGLTFD
jgi:poly-gamma-glutamate synthesis protein (capsule biosynthesis protein)